jgi:hypothetical protein
MDKKKIDHLSNVKTHKRVKKTFKLLKVVKNSLRMK